MNQALLTSKDQTWTTPKDFFNNLNDEFGFTLDAFASDENALCENYFTEEQDSLKQDWSGHTVFMNPPYGRMIGKCVKKAWEESKKGTTIVALIPARTDTTYWHDYIFGHATEIRYIKGRLKFGDGNNPAPFPSAVVVWNGKN